jgi:hypothetical protein
MENTQEIINLINIAMFILGVLIIAAMAVILNTIEKNHLKTQKLIIEMCAKAKADTVERQLNIPDVVKPKGTFCGCGKPYSQKDLEDGMCNKCCAPTGYS